MSAPTEGFDFTDTMEDMERAFNSFRSIGITKLLMRGYDAIAQEEGAEQAAKYMEEFFTDRGFMYHLATQNAERASIIDEMLEDGR